MSKFRFENLNTELQNEHQIYYIPDTRKFSGNKLSGKKLATTDLLPTIMRDTFYTLFLVFQLTICHGQNQENPTEFCVINLLGAELYEDPSFESRILYKLKIGDKLTSKTIISTNDTKMVGPNFNLGGDWIKTNVSGFNGFVFSSDLTKKNSCNYYKCLWTDNYRLVREKIER